MSTITELRTRLQDRGYGIDTNSTQDRFLEEAYVQLQNFRRWDWLYEQVSIVVPTGTKFIAEATITALQSFRTIDGVRVREHSNELDYLNPERYDTVISPALLTSGIPEVWTYRMGTGLFFYPAASESLTIDINLITRLPNFATIASGQVPIPPELEEWVLWTAIKNITFRERDVDGYQLAENNANTIMAAYLAQHGLKQRQSSGRVQKSGVHQAYDESLWQV